MSAATVSYSSPLKLKIKKVATYLIYDFFIFD